MGGRRTAGTRAPRPEAACGTRPRRPRRRSGHHPRASMTVQVTDQGRALSVPAQDVRHVVRSRSRRRDRGDDQPDSSPPKMTSLPSRELVRRVRAATGRRPARRTPRCRAAPRATRRRRRGPASTWVSAIAVIVPPRDAASATGAIQPGTRRVAGVDEDARPPPDRDTSRPADPATPPPAGISIRTRSRVDLLHPDLAEGAGGQVPRTSPKSVTCSSCWSVVLVGTHSARSPSAIASSASDGRIQRWSTTSSPAMEATAPEGQLGGEEPGVEPARQRRRRHPARDRDEPVGPERQVELGGEGLEPDLPADQGRARGTEHPGRRRRAVGQQDPGLLEDLADRGDERGDRRGRVEVAAQGRGRLLPRADRARDEARVRIGRVDATAGEDVDVRGEGHRWRSAPQEDLGSRRSRTASGRRSRRAGARPGRRPVGGIGAILVRRGAPRAPRGAPPASSPAAGRRTRGRRRPWACRRSRCGRRGAG